MSKGGRSQTTTTTNALDPNAAGMQRDVYDAARRAAGGYQFVGPNGATTDALAGWQRFAGAGMNGLAALGGDQAAMSAFMNPYQQQVIDRMGADYARTASGLTSKVNSDATMAGAFGGSRHGVAEGVAQGELANNYLTNIAGVRQQGFNNAQNIAGQVANLGFGANQQLGGLGEYLRELAQTGANPEAAKLGILGGAFAGTPYGSSSTQTTPLQRSWGSGLLGGAASGAGIGKMFGPHGAAIGAGLGGLIGLFG